MTRQIAVCSSAQTSDASRLEPKPRGPGLVSLLLLSAWCGLVAGLLEVGTIALRKQVFDPNRLYWMSRHFAWLIPLTNVGLFLVLGLCGCVVGAAWPRRGRWLVLHVLCAIDAVANLLDRFPADLHAGMAGGGLRCRDTGWFRGF